VLRVVDVPASCMLSELHDLLHVAMGWTNSHLHRLLAGDACYRVPDQEFDTDERDEAGFDWPIWPPRFGYLYDFGDGWTHDIEVLGPGEARPGCDYGEGRCPASLTVVSRRDCRSAAACRR
jgi:hypothetical protein